MSYSTECSPSNDSRFLLQANTRKPSAALLGASYAFSPSPVPANPITNTYSGLNGALAAATFAGSRKQGQEKKPGDLNPVYGKAEQSLGLEKPSTTSFPRKIDSDKSEKEGGLGMSDKAREQSHSYIAALAATKRPSPHRPGPSTQLMQSDRSDLRSIMQHTEDAPILPTKALIKIFELQADNLSLPSEPHSSSNASTRTSVGIAGRPPSQLLPSSKRTDIARIKNSPSKTQWQDGTLISQPKVGPRIVAPISELPAAQLERSKSRANIKGAPPTPPPQRGSGKNHSLVKLEEKESFSFSKKSDESSSASFGVPLNGRWRTAETAQPHNEGKWSFSLDAPSFLPHRPSPGGRRGSEKASIPGLQKPSREGPLLAHSLTPQLTADSLANAMVASSLASSRAPSPSKLLPPPARHQPRPRLRFRSQSHEQGDSRTSSPGRPMRQTMRESPKPDDDDDEYYYKRKGGHILKKHPNKHHEGDRKRWRDQITERERKRYEGLWAANKDIFLPVGGGVYTAGTVLDLVVRDIWRRSRLPDDVLAEVWDLVDGRGRGALGKEEFVVGTWLIDQRLKGRKLPVKVSESVWFSARGLSGIKASKRHR